MDNFHLLEIDAYGHNATLLLKVEYQLIPFPTAESIHN